MSVEQIISILQACGYAMVLPMLVCVIGIVITIRRPLPETPVKRAKRSDLPTKKDRQATEGIMETRPKRKRRNAQYPSIVCTPVVTAVIPEAAQQCLSKLLEHSATIPSSWRIITNGNDPHYREEVNK